METIGDRIKEKRKELGLTQLELAEKLNVTDRAVSKWEQGEGDPSIAILPELAKIFDVTLDYLMTGKQVDIISLDDMDTNKRLEYLIKKDDVDNYKKYGYTIKNKGTIDFEYQYPFSGYCRDTHHKFDTALIKMVIDNKAKKIFNYICDEICSEYKMVSLACLFDPILDDVIKMAIDIDRADVLSVVGFNYLSVNDNKQNTSARWNGSYVLPLLIVSPNGGSLSEYERLVNTLTISSSTFNYLFENKNDSPKCYKFVMDLEIKKRVNDKDYFIYNRDNPYRLLEKAVELSDFSFIEKFFRLAKEQFDVTDFSTKDNYFYGNRTNYDNNCGYLYNNHSIISRLFYIPQNVIYYLIDNNKDNLAREMMDYNTKLSSSLNSKLRIEDSNRKYNYFSMKGIEVKRYKDLNNSNISEKEKELIQCVDNHIITSYLTKKNDLKFVRKILDENYYHPYEFVFKCLHNKKEKELFKYFIDTENENLSDLLLKGKEYYNELLFNTYKVFEDDQNPLMIKDNIKKLNDYLKETISRQDEKIAEEDHMSESFIKINGSIEDYIANSSCNFMDKNNPIIRHIEDLKEDIYNKVKARLDAQKKEEEAKKERARAVKGLTKEYFQDLLKKSENELFIIKLSSLLDAILKFDYRYEQEDFAERLKAYCDYCESLLPKSRDMDDGWGYSVLDTKYEKEVVKPEREKFDRKANLLNRLRMLRNNIAHAETKKVKEFSPEEMVECMDLVCSMNKKEEE